MESIVHDHARRPQLATVAERYRLIAELGRGGMANVYLAVTESIDDVFTKLVVIKQLREHLSNDPEFVTMFLDEARIAARLNHPNVVQTLDSGRAGGGLFLAMEYLDGQPLHRIVARNQTQRGPFGPTYEMTILSDVLGGLHHAHTIADFDGSQLNVVHRDVTPHNVFVTYDGQVKVVDFGIAHAEGRASRTRHGIIKGKIAYMAPEQARADRVDARTDVFAVGVMLFEALTGTRLWLEQSEKDVLRRLLTNDVPGSPIERARLVQSAETRVIAPALDAICRRALAADPRDRYSSARAMQQELDAVLDADFSRPSARRMGAELAALFADRRDITRRVIESQLSELRAKRVTKLAALPEQNEDERHDAKTRVVRDETQLSAPDAALLAVTREDATQPAGANAAPKPRTMRRNLMLAGAVVALVSLGATLASVIRDLVPVGADRLVRVTLHASPAHARFRIDDGEELPNPYRGVLRADTQAEHSPHRIVTSAEGYVATEERIRFTEDVSLRVVLTSR